MSTSPEPIVGHAHHSTRRDRPAALELPGEDRRAASDRENDQERAISLSGDKIVAEASVLLHVLLFSLRSTSIWFFC